MTCIDGSAGVAYWLNLTELQVCQGQRGERLECCVRSTGLLSYELVTDEVPVTDTRNVFRSSSTNLSGRLVRPAPSIFFSPTYSCEVRPRISLLGRVYYKRLR